jgi:hypothetical protein
MKIGRVCFNIEYVVDLDNSEMIDAAKELICEDVDDIVEYNSHNDFIDIEEAVGYTPDMITSVIKEMFAEDDEIR